MSQQQGSRGFDNGCIEGFLRGIDDEAPLQYSSGGMAYMRFAIPISAKKNRDGTRDDATIWINCVAFGRTAEAMASMLENGTLKPGSLVRAQGFFHASEYQGNARLELNVSSLSLLANPLNVDERSSRPPGGENAADNLPF